jgi:hypothetical protein
MARPSPLRRPALPRISDSERCPRTTATIEIGKKKMNRPQIRLAIALPLVSAGAAIVGAGPAAAETATSFPQTRQNLSPAPTSFPQLVQIRLCDLRTGGEESCLHRNFCSTLLFALLYVNLLT